jgi:hypothetical protein
MMAEQGLEVGQGLAGAGKGQIAQKQGQAQAQEGDLQRRLDALKNI